jgi:predicted NAD/FAD-dependent oxidoreductase
MSDVAPAYAPPGQALISVSLLRLAPAEARARAAGLAREELRAWYGPVVDTWRELRTVVIPEALPAYPAGTPAFRPSATAEKGVFLAGDALTIPSQEGAATSGRRAADAVAAYLENVT